MKIKANTWFYKFYQWGEKGKFPESLGEYIFKIIFKLFLCFIPLGLLGGSLVFGLKLAFDFVRESPFIAGKILAGIVIVVFLFLIPISVENDS